MAAVGDLNAGMGLEKNVSLFLESRKNANKLADIINMPKVRQIFIFSNFTLLEIDVFRWNPVLTSKHGYLVWKKYSLLLAIEGIFRWIAHYMLQIIKVLRIILNSPWFIENSFRVYCWRAVREMVEGNVWNELGENVPIIGFTWRRCAVTSTEHSFEFNISGCSVYIWQIPACQTSGK